LRGLGFLRLRHAARSMRPQVTCDSDCVHLAPQLASHWRGWREMRCRARTTMDQRIELVILQCS
jgi:hypothetical protein